MTYLSPGVQLVSPVRTLKERVELVFTGERDSSEKIKSHEPCKPLKCTSTQNQLLRETICLCTSHNADVSQEGGTVPAKQACRRGATRKVHLRSSVSLRPLCTSVWQRGRTGDEEAAPKSLLQTSILGSSTLHSKGPGKGSTLQSYMREEMKILRRNWNHNTLNSRNDNPSQIYRTHSST